MKRFLKIMATSICVVMLLGSAIFAANPTSGFGITFYAGEGRVLVTSGAATKGNRNSYMTVRTTSLSGNRANIMVYGSNTAAGSPVTGIVNPPAAGSAANWAYTRAVSIGENLYLCGYTDSRLAGSLQGTFTP